MNTLRQLRALTNKEGKPILDQEDIELVHRAVLARCDLDDGVKDGIVGNPAACGFDPATLICKSESR